MRLTCWQIATKTTLARIACMACDLENSHTLWESCESVYVTMKTTINFCDMTTFCYFVIKEKFE